MTIFDDRGRAFETLFAQDHGLQDASERNKAIGLWAAAHRLGISGQERISMGPKSLCDPSRRAATLSWYASGDLAAHGAKLSDRHIQRRMEESSAEVIDRVKTE